MRQALPALLLAAALGAAPPAAAAGDDLPARVNRAIDRGAANLVSRQAADGSWQKEDRVHPLGRTALCAFTLLHAGRPPEDPAVRKALEFLGILRGYGCKVAPRSTYEAGCLVLLLNALGRGHERAVQDVCAWLVEHFNDAQGLWGYPDGTPDLSNTQFAAMALKAGEKRGFETPPRIWRRLVDSVARLQARGGAVRYRGGAMYRATMTHAALLVLRFAEEALGANAPRREIREASERAQRWLEENYSVERTPFGRGWQSGNYYYYMWGLERYAVTFGLKEIAGHDWYREGAEVLLARQAADGAWGSLEETCFAILFLRRVTLTEPDAPAAAPGAPAPPGPAPAAAAPPAPPRPEAGVPCLREWFLAGPFPGTKEEDDGLFDPPVDPRLVRVPAEGGPAGKRKWIAWTSPTDRVDFEKAPTGNAGWASFAAACFLHAEADADAVLWLGSDDGLRAWLDGKEILFGHHHDHSGDDFYRVPLRLAKGRHLLLLQVENLEYYCHFQARITGPDGARLSAVAGSLSPAAK